MDLCQQSDVSAFEYDVWVCHSFSFKEQVSFSFMAAVTVHSDFGAQGNTVCHSFRISPSMHVLLVCLSLQCVVFADLKSWQPISSCLMVCVWYVGTSVSVCSPFSSLMELGGGQEPPPPQSFATSNIQAQGGDVT